MGVYINMEMPTEGYIDVRIKCNGTASFAIADNPYFKAVEAIPVPPHGDLIDREALMDDIIGSMVFSGRNVPKEAAIVQKVLDIVGDANAIIPASEEDE